MFISCFHVCTWREIKIYIYMIFFPPDFSICSAEVSTFLQVLKKLKQKVPF